MGEIFFPLSLLVSPTFLDFQKLKILYIKGNPKLEIIKANLEIIKDFLCFRLFKNEYRIYLYSTGMLLNTVMIYGLGAQTNSSLLPQDALSNNLRKSGLKKPVVASSLKRQGKFSCPRIS